MKSAETTTQEKPGIYGEIVLCFDVDFDVHEITQILGVSPSSLGRRSEMRIHPLTGEQNPGFWEYRTQTAFAYDSDCVLDELHLFLKAHAEEIIRIKKVYPCDVILRLYADAGESADAPGIWLDRALMKAAAALDASIEIAVTFERPIEE